MTRFRLDTVLDRDAKFARDYNNYIWWGKFWRITGHVVGTIGLIALLALSVAYVIGLGDLAAIAREVQP